MKEGLNLLYNSYILLKHKIKKFKTSVSMENIWSGPKEDESLFNLWKKLKQHLEKKSEQGTVKRGETDLRR